MADVVIRRCTFRIVRHGGWSWGPDPSTLLASAVTKLPALLAAKLAALWPDDADVEINEPISLRIPVTRNDLLAFANEATVSAPGDGAVLRSRLEEALDFCFAEHADKRAALSFTRSTSREFGTRAAGLQSVGPADLLLRWQLSGEIDAILALFDRTALLEWVKALRSAADACRMPADEERDAALASLRGLIESRPVIPADASATGRLRWILAAAAAIARETRTRPDRPAVWQAIDVYATRSAVGSSGSQAAAIDAPTTTAGPVVFPAAAQTRTTRSSPAIIEAPEYREGRMPSALPFLLLRPLAATGYLDTLSGVFEASGLSRDLPLFAAALALKALDPPGRGWRRDALMPAASLFAGLGEPVGEPDLAALARLLEDRLSPLDAVLTRSLVRGHRPGDRLLFDRTADGFTLTEVEGLFPICWRPEVSMVLPIIEELGSVVVVPADVATPPLLNELAGAGVTVATESSPDRGEAWREWLRDVSARQRGVWNAMASRPVVPLAPGCGMDRSVTLAVTVSLSAIGWTMWRLVEPTDALLVLDRFDKFDAYVRVDPELVRVRLPLGARYLDLQRHGLLDPVRDVPWLGGRELVFSGG